MHIEPGLIHGAKIVVANATIFGLLAFYLRELISSLPRLLIRTILAAIFFSLFMESFHLNVGPSELHFVGAMAIYFTLGFIPVLYGFFLGLFLQGVFFEPMDLVHLSVNSLSLILPLIAVHYSMGKQILSQDLSKVSFKSILKLDLAYYSGVTIMVGFWLLGEGTTTFVEWARFAVSYLVVIVVEPFVTLGAVILLRNYRENNIIKILFETGSV